MSQRSWLNMAFVRGCLGVYGFGFDCAPAGPVVCSHVAEEQSFFRGGH
jgi:hypothetical protein